MGNLILKTDSYKASHYKQYPPDSTKVYSYIESRGGEFAETVFFGLQMFLKKYFIEPFTFFDIHQAEDFFKGHGLPFNKDGWAHILMEHDGFLPILIKAVPEGSVIPTGNILCSIENTDPECFWLTSYLEMMLLRAIWYPTTVATISRKAKEIIYKYLIITSEDPDGQIPFKLHDFGARGVSSGESAEIGGAAHLVNFMGSDTVEGVLAANKYYNHKMSAFSIPAAEHSTICAWGKDSEEEAFSNMIDQFGQKDKLVAVVSDSYDIYKAVDLYWGKNLKDKVLDSGCTLIIRPDSGHPPTVVFNVLKSLSESFGYTVNSRGYKVLNPAVRVIQGDGCNLEMIEAILKGITGSGYSADNLAFGMGGGLLQQCNRDTLGFAMKASAVVIDNIERGICKTPVTDKGKDSKQGRQILLRLKNTFKTLPLRNSGDLKFDYLQEVFRDGELLIDQNLDEIRKRASLES
jgi:nicotinamide phosphoribosyltransferase